MEFFSREKGSAACEAGCMYSCMYVNCEQHTRFVKLDHTDRCDARHPRVSQLCVRPIWQCATVAAHGSLGVQQGHSTTGPSGLTL
jgi:hypothetical protein